MAKLTPQPPQSPDDRNVDALVRDRAAETFDVTAEARDELALLRDARAEARDVSAGWVDLDAASDRRAARRDRQSSSGDRGHARHDREAAWTDRSLSAKEHADLLVDGLTGTYRRAAGFLELEREIIKAERTQQSYVLAFLDVNGLKSVNDSLGHGAGDTVLRLVVDTVRAQVREYDIIVRYGGDEFVCGLPDMSLTEVTERLDAANAQLLRQHGTSVSVGLALRETGEGLETLIERADAAMYRSRESR